jgi:two-component system nitrogen regulation response regulator GlnG
MINNELPVREDLKTVVYSAPSDRVPLMERQDDILPMSRRFIREAEEQLKTTRKELSDEAKDYLLNHNWPGDEDELETAVKRACILSEGELLEVEDFDYRKRRVKSVGKFIEEKLRGFMSNIKTLEKFNIYDMVIPEVERSLILMVMKETGGNQVRAARLLGINRNTLRSKIRKLSIDLKQ